MLDNITNAVRAVFFYRNSAHALGAVAGVGNSTSPEPEITAGDSASQQVSPALSGASSGGNPQIL